MVSTVIGARAEPVTSIDQGKSCEISRMTSKGYWIADFKHPMTKGEHI
jgi:hypothetical protein